VMDHGQIIECGTHDGLLAQEGAYLLRPVYDGVKAGTQSRKIGVVPGVEASQEHINPCAYSMP
jgi:hypothetical protein